MGRLTQQLGTKPRQFVIVPFDDDTLKAEARDFWEPAGIYRTKLSEFEDDMTQRMQVIVQYLTLGFTHIVPRGLDHILFVLGLFLLTTRVKPLLAQVTSFTLAHSITLGLTMYGVVSLPSKIVEPAIALSIAYVAIENIVTNELKPWRVAIVFAFGLLHGMGFAGVLRELGLPRREFVTALVSFNAGVEGGQLFVIGIAAILFARKWRHRVVVPASLLIAATGLFWTVQRLIT